MGRPSKLSDQQWDELGAKLAAGERPAALSEEYGVSKAAISKRMSGQYKSATRAIVVTQAAPIVEKRGRGAVSSFTPEIGDEICVRLSEGEPLRQICRDEHMPAWRTVYDWKDADSDFNARFLRARDMGFDALAEDTIMMLDEAPERTETQFGDKVDPGHVQWQKNRVEQRMKLLAKWDPRRYGEKMAIGGAADLPPVQQAVLNATVIVDPNEAAAAYAQLMKAG